MRNGFSIKFFIKFRRDVCLFRNMVQDFSAYPSLKQNYAENEKLEFYSRVNVSHSLTRIIKSRAIKYFGAPFL